jgi:hypothetical protein
MATNRDLLKEAIADAKAVKEMAIANAKAALEESFTPQLKSMLSAKLQEMEEEDLDENNDIFELEDEINEENDLDLDELLNELNEEDEMESEEEEMESEEGEPLDLEDMTDEDLKKLIEDVIADMVASGELEAGEGGEEIPEEEEGDDIEDEEEINIDELLAEMEMDDYEGFEDDFYDDDEAEELNRLGVKGTMDDDFTPDSLEEEEDLDEIFGFGKQGSGGTSFVKKFIDANKAEIASAKGNQEEGKKLIAKFYNENVKKMDGSALRSDVSVLRTALGMKELGGGSKSVVSTSESLQKDLDEALATIETLRQDLNEVNLLNAKLLYTNKIFKAKNNLTENQKVKVLNMFDKAATVKETKLVYETLSEGLKDTRNPIKESLGMASKIMGTTNSKQPILESDPMVSRFQKLAGII